MKRAHRRVASFASFTLRALVASVSVAVLAAACASEPQRVWYNDLGPPDDAQASDSTTEGASGEAAVDGSGFADGQDDGALIEASLDGPTGLDEGGSSEAGSDGALAESGVPTDAATESGTEAGGEAGSEGGADAGGDSSPDAAADACTKNNCGICGQPMCSTGNVCCTPSAGNPGGCGITHNGGYTNTVTYYDCEAVGTDDATAAGDACKAYTGSAASCANVSCGGGNDAICSQGAAGQNCWCWGYNRSGGFWAGAGYVRDSHSLPGSGVGCRCPTGNLLADSAWN